MVAPGEVDNHTAFLCKSWFESWSPEGRHELIVQCYWEASILLCSLVASGATHACLLIAFAHCLLISIAVHHCLDGRPFG